jgi:hypothetical protein
MSSHSSPPRQYRTNISGKKGGGNGVQLWSPESFEVGPEVLAKDGGLRR